MQIAEALVGCSLPLTKLTQELHQLYTNDNSNTAVTQLAIRNHIQEIASRKLLDSERGVRQAHPALTCSCFMHTGRDGSNFRAVHAPACS